MTSDLVLTPGELAELITAIRVINTHHHLGDAIYDVRNRASETMRDGDGSSWDHPDVKAYSAAVSTLARLRVLTT